MLKTIKKTLLVLCTSMATQVALSQNSRLTEHNTIGWYSVVVTPQLSKKVSLHGEYQWRRVKLVKEWQQSLLRAGVTYKVHPQVSLQVGYAWAPTFPYGTYTLAAVPRVFTEHRVYEQVVVTSAVGKATLTNRLRLEQRWIGRFANAEAEKPAFVFLNRFRFMPRVDFPIAEKWYAAASDEILIGFGKNVGENIFDQNRVSAVIGYKPSTLFRIEGGFVNQIVQLGREIENKNIFQYNNGIVISTYFNL